MLFQSTREEEAWTHFSCFLSREDRLSATVDEAAAAAFGKTQSLLVTIGSVSPAEFELTSLSSAWIWGWFGSGSYISGHFWVNFRTCEDLWSTGHHGSVYISLSGK